MGSACGTEPGAACGHDHLVEFYETEAFLVDTVCAFVGKALRDGDAAVVVATAAHRHEFEAALATAGIDVGAAAREGRYLAYDAAEVLARFMVAGRPDATRFRAEIGGVLDRASEGGRNVRVYGEMVALLWDDGNTAATVALEELWNDLAQARPFALLCAYPLGVFGDRESGSAFKRICEQHTGVIPSEGYSLLTDPAARSRAVAQLQQEAAALRGEVLRLRPQQARDQAGGQRDEAGARRRQAGGQRDEGGARRRQAGEQRDVAGLQRDVAGLERDEAGLQRDVAGEQRDQAAERRDHAAERSEASASPAIETDALNRSALARREAASDRRRASQDRRAGASERTEAELDRDTALTDRGASARERDQSSHDQLTGAYLRGAGFLALDREIARATRTGEPLVLAFIDVDGLKAINDSRGHAAGDRMLLEVADAFRANLRSYDLLIRYGGDEFLCAISGLHRADAAHRVALVNATLAEAPEPGSVTAGLAQLRLGDSREDLVAQADAALYRERDRCRVSRA